MESRSLDHGDGRRRSLTPGSSPRTKRQARRKRRRREDAALRALLERGNYDLALVLTSGQYLLYHRQGEELRAKGISASSVRAAFVNEPVDSGWLPAGVQRLGSSAKGAFLVRFFPPGRYSILLVPPGESQPRPLVVPLPAIVFAGLGTTYYVWAIKEPIFTPDAQLWHIPLPNVYPGGRICFGVNRPPEVAGQTSEEAWKLFIESPFNADLVRDKSVHHADIRVQLVALHESEAQTYPDEDLLAYRQAWHTRFWQRRSIQTVQDAVTFRLLNQEEDA